MGLSVRSVRPPTAALTHEAPESRADARIVMPRGYAHPVLEAAHRRMRRTRHSGQVFGLASTHTVRREPTDRRFPGVMASKPSAGDGGRSCTPLRDSPGFPPGSLFVPREALRRRPTTFGAPHGLGGEPTASSSLVADSAARFTDTRMRCVVPLMALQTSTAAHLLLLCSASADQARHSVRNVTDITFEFRWGAAIPPRVQPGRRMRFGRLADN